MNPKFNKNETRYDEKLKERIARKLCRPKNDVLAVIDNEGNLYTFMHKYSWDNIVEAFYDYKKLKKQLEQEHANRIETVAGFVSPNQSGDTKKVIYDKTFKIIHLKITRTTTDLGSPLYIG